MNNRVKKLDEELHVKLITDKRAIKKLKKLHQEVLEGKRKTITDEQFLAEFGQ